MNSVCYNSPNFKIHIFVYLYRFKIFIFGIKKKSFSFFEIRLTVNSPFITPITTLPSVGSSERLTIKISPFDIPAFIIEFPFTLTKKVAEGFFIRYSLMSNFLSIKSSAGEGNPAEIVLLKSLSKRVLLLSGLKNSSTGFCFSDYCFFKISIINSLTKIIHYRCFMFENIKHVPL